MAGRTIEIPEEIYTRIEKMLPELNLDSVDACVTYVLATALDDGRGGESLTEGEEDEMRQRLADLGYL